MICVKCGAELKPEAKFCVSCGTKVTAAANVQPAQHSAPVQQYAQAPRFASDVRTGSPMFSFDKLLFNQKKISLGNKYYVFNEQGQELFYVWRKILALKRHIKVFTDRTESTVALEVTQDHIFAILYSWYTLLDASGNTIARMRRNNILSILRRTWQVFLPDGSLLMEVAEDSWGKALFRRFGPFGELMKTDFIFQSSGNVIGKFIRKITLFDKYVLDLTMDPQRSLDRRIALAFCVLLDSAEAR
jgi:uncharacterized protein YxjI